LPRTDEVPSAEVYAGAVLCLYNPSSPKKDIWTGELAQKAVILHRTGMSLRETARTLKLSYSAVKQLFERLPEGLRP
jgi:transposase-like protein